MSAIQLFYAKNLTDGNVCLFKTRYLPATDHNVMRLQFTEVNHVLEKIGKRNVCSWDYSRTGLRAQLQVALGKDWYVLSSAEVFQTLESFKP